MKYLFLPIIAILFLSCNDSNVVISKEEYDKLTGVSKSEYPKRFHFMKGSKVEKMYDWQIILGQDDHEYIENDAGYDSNIIMHSPECKLCRNRQLIQPQDTTSCQTKQ